MHDRSRRRTPRSRRLTPLVAALCLATMGCSEPHEAVTSETAATPPTSTASTVPAALTGPYLGQTPPGTTAERFHGGVLVGDKRSFNLSFSPDGRELFFSYYKGTEAKPEPAYEIKTYRQVDGVWHGPETAPFSGVYSDVDITFSPDGDTLFFASDRPHPETAGLDIYYVERQGEGWSEPIHAGTEVNTPSGEVLPCLSTRGHLFFRSERPGGFGGADIYRAKWVDGRFTEVTNLGPNINTEHGETDPIIAPDERYLLYDSIRPEHDDIPQIYVSFQIEDDVWSEGISLGDAVNKKEGTSAPTLSPDGRYLFFKHRQGEDRGLYWISTEVIEQLRENVLARRSGEPS